MEEKIREALAKLDPSNDAHWTADGMPAMAVVEELVGDKSIKRKDVTSAAPGFTRSTPSLGSPSPSGDPQPDPEDQAAKSPSPDPQPDPDDGPEEEPDADEEEAAFQAADERVQKAVKGLEEAQKELSQAQKELDLLVAERERKSAGRTSQHDIMNFIASQNRLRQERATARQRLTEQLGGVDPAEVGAAAPIDRAMARKNTRGAGRPTRDPIVG